MLLLKALQTKTKDEWIKRQIEANINEGGSNRLRLKPIKKDREAFSLVVQGRCGEYDGKSQIKENYRFFLRELESYQDRGYTFEDIYNSFLRLKIVCIGLDKGDDDPQVVFESINATCLHLEGVDMICNFLMIGEDSKHQEELYAKYWEPIEVWLEKEVEKFVEHYLRIYYGIDVKKDNVYNTFKRHSKDNFSDKQSLMDDMYNYARIYKIFVSPDDFVFRRSGISQKEMAILKRYIRIIITLNFGVAYPFIMRLLRDFEEETLGFDDFSGMLEILISYYVRRQVCGIETNALNKVVYTLYKRLKREDSINAYGLQRFFGGKSGREIFPNDELTKMAFERCDAYSLKSCKFILLEIEKLNNSEPPMEQNLSIEHFYPQSATQSWRDMVRDYEILESNYKHTFGNLTLTGQNSRLSNKSFLGKVRAFGPKWLIALE